MSRRLTACLLLLGLAAWNASGAASLLHSHACHHADPQNCHACLLLGASRSAIIAAPLALPERGTLVARIAVPRPQAFISVDHHGPATPRAPPLA
ncbi:MAG: hypothetical protein U1A27_00630 [Phycisphaerae bacterium]